MKLYLSHQLFLILLFWATPIVTFGIRGAAERVLAYYAYLADDLPVNPGASHTIAVGCVGAGGGRCNFNEFCMYIDDRTNPPNFNVLSPTDNFLDQNIDRLIQAVDQWRGPKGERMTGLISPSKMVSGASDYNDALEKLGIPIGKLSAVADQLPDGATKDAWKQITTGGRNVGSSARLLRYKDVEKYRVPVMKAYLQSLKPPIKLILEPGPAISCDPASYRIHSRRLTVSQFTNTADQTRAFNELKNANNKYKSQSSVTNRHYNTLKAITQARKNIDCTEP